MAAIKGTVAFWTAAVAIEIAMSVQADTSNVFLYETVLSWVVECVQPCSVEKLTLDLPKDILLIRNEETFAE